jgi:succinate dehydrogenase / fumarate reductase cytochrome b subunit
VGQPEFGYGQVLWLVRFVLLACVLLHITAALQLTRLNQKARPVGCDTKKDIDTSLGARTMRWGGVLLLVFVVFHIFHMTLGAVGFEPGQFDHLAVYQNAVAAFPVWPISLFYIVAMGALCLHLDHGIWSALQTLGWSNAQNTKTLKAAARIIAIVVFAGFSSVPIAVLAGWVR